MDTNPVLVGDMMGGLMKWLTDEVKEMKTWREECQLTMNTLSNNYNSVQQKCNTLQLRSIQQKMGILKAQGKILESQTTNSIRAIFYKKLRRYLKLNIGKRRRKAQSRNTMLTVLSSSTICMQQRYFIKWLLWGTNKAELTRKLTQCMSLQLRSANHNRLIYFKELQRHRSRMMLHRAITDRLSSMVSNGFLKVHFELLYRHREKRLNRKRIESMIYTMCTASAHTVMSVAWRRLCKYSKRRSLIRVKSIIKTRALTNFIKTTESGTRLYCYKTWLSLVEKKRSRSQREMLADVMRKVGKLDDKMVEEGKTVTSVQRTLKAFEERMGDDQEQRRYEEVIASLKFSLSENDRAIHILDNKCGDIKNLAISSLKEAMREVDDIITSIKSDQATNARQTKSTVLSSLTELEESTSIRMVRLEKTLADLLTADRQQIKYDLDARTDAMSKEFADTRNQVDVSLKSLANTNTVLNKVVNRMISVDHHLEELDRSSSQLPQTHPRDISPMRQRFDPITGRSNEDISLQRRHE